MSPRRSSSASRLARIPRHVLVGATAALTAAALHLAIVTFSRDVLGRFTWLWSTRDVVWMLPLGYLTVFSLLSVPLGMLAALRHNGLSVRTTAWVWGTIVLFAVALLFQRVHALAWLVLALGGGYQFARVAARDLQFTSRLALRGGAALTMLFAVLITVVEGKRSLNTRRAVAGSRAASRTAPNVLLIVWDAARAKNLSLYGHHRLTTPFLDSLARHAVVFERAYSTAPWTLPSHASMFTGRYATQQSGDRLSPMDGRHRTLAEALRDNGYATGGFVANLQYASYATGLQRGFVHYQDTYRTLGEVAISTTLTQSYSVLAAFLQLYHDGWVAGAARRFLRFDGRPFGGMFPWPARREGTEITDGFLRWQQNNPTRPFFAFLNYMEVHDPLDAPTRDHFDRGATAHDRYDGAVYSLDLELKRLVGELERRGVLGRTILVLTSDHGELIQEHGLNGHSTSLYLNVLHVPLVILAPGHPTAGSRVSRVVSLRDLPATILGLARITDSVIPGRMLLPNDSVARASLEPSPAISETSVGINERPPHRTYYGDLASVIDDSLHVIRDGTGEYQVFAYRRDMEELNDLTRNAGVAAWARLRIDSFVQQFGLRPPNVAVAASSQRQ